MSSKTTMILLKNAGSKLGPSGAAALLDVLLLDIQLLLDARRLCCSRLDWSAVKLFSLDDLVSSTSEIITISRSPAHTT